MSIDKKCNKCSKTMPATDEYFYRQKLGKDGLEGQCKECVKRRRKLRYSPKIYKITNSNNGKIYVGQTIKPVTERYSQHFSNAKSGSVLPLHKDIKKQNFIRKDFLCEILEEGFEENLLDEKEKFWIDKYLTNGFTLYNREGGGKKDTTVSDDTKVLQSRSRGIKGEIDIYDWVEKRFIGTYKTMQEVFNQIKVNISDKSKRLESSYIVSKNFLLIYKDKNYNVDEIIEKINREYLINHLGNAHRRENHRLKGSSNGIAKLDEKIVKNIILDLIKGVKNKELCIKYNLSASVISSINVRKTWNHVVVEGHEDDEIYNLKRKRRKETL